MILQVFWKRESEKTSVSQPKWEVHVSWKEFKKKRVKHENDSRATYRPSKSDLLPTSMMEIFSFEYLCASSSQYWSEVNVSRLGGGQRTKSGREISSHQTSVIWILWHNYARVRLSATGGIESCHKAHSINLKRSQHHIVPSDVVNK